MTTVTKFESICDCGTRDALVCKDNPDCRPSYCKMSFYDRNKAKAMLSNSSGIPGCGEGVVLSDVCVVLTAADGEAAK